MEKALSVNLVHLSCSWPVLTRRIEQFTLELLDEIDENKLK